MTLKIIDYIHENKAGLFQLLEELVLIQSYSRNKKGVDRVGEQIAKQMTQIGFSCEFTQEKDLGNTLIARSPKASGQQGQEQILITGHMDTVFPEDTSFNWYKESDTQCFGPGVADMKGGLVVGIFALKALVHLGLAKNKPITFIFNSDEEIGSPTSRELIRKEAQRSKLGLVLEAGGMNNEIVTGRKGNLSVDLTVKGQAGHAAFAGKNKASAIVELAHKTLAIEAINQPEKGISANVGTINGGIGPNTVPDLARAGVDFRFLTDKDARQVQENLDRIVQHQRVPNTRSEMRVVSSRPPMPQTLANQDLFKTIEGLAHTLKTPVIPELRQGVSDANIIASQGIPVIDGLGPQGEKDHSEDEYIKKASLWERSILFATILNAL
ncbi:MAG: M20 family metallopeptidase [Desulfobacter sp.]|nr:M20 family metallopeptidase [Desulfobacter sp.]